MSFDKIKLIVSDMDGTLLRSNHELSPEFKDIYNQLKDKGIKFVPASGRQFYSITSYFEDEKDNMAIIAENGTYVTYKGEEIFIDELDKKLVENVILESRKIAEANLVLAGKNSAYIESNDKDFQNFFKNFYSKNIVVDDLLKVIENEKIIKIAIQHNNGSEANLYPNFKPLEKFGVQIVVSGEVWLDIMNKDTNKGKALKELQNNLNISKNETMVFGDYMNDIEMLKLAKYSFAMENAHPLVKEISNYTAPSNDNDGVIQILKQVIKS